MAKISIVDSNHENVSSITQLMKQKGHVLNSFSTSTAFMTSLKQKQPEMIIIGVQLDGEDGRELAKLLQLDVLYKDIPVILTSPFYHTDQEIRSFCCDDLVSMPFEASRLTTSVEVLLAKEQAKASRLDKVPV
jgi:two-component SAPR family response regulator